MRLIVALLLVLCVGCTQNVDLKQSVTNETPKTVLVDDAINLAMNMPKTLNPLINADPSVDSILKLSFETLITFDETYKPIPCIANSISYDGNVATVGLGNRTWADGKRITTTDVAYSIDILKDNPTIYKSCAEQIVGYRIVDDTTLTINMNSGFQSVYALNFPIIPKHFYNHNENSLAILSSGNYKFKSFTYKSLELESDETKLQVKIIPVDAHFDAFNQKLIDVMNTKQEDLGKLNTKCEQNLYDTNEFELIGLNLSNPLLKIKLIRQAIYNAIDFNIGLTKANLCNPNSWLSQNIIHTLDIDKAKSLFEQYPAEFDILVNIENNERVKIANELKKQLDNVGIKASVTKLPFTDYENRIRTHAYDMFVGGYELSLQPDYDFLLRTSQNPFAYSNPIMDEALDKVKMVSDETSFKQSLQVVYDILHDDIPFISLGFKHNVVLVNDNVICKPMFFNVLNGLTRHQSK